jgi:PLP dependent protein
LATSLDLDQIEYQSFQDRLLQVQADIAAAARATGRQPADITLVGVSKFVPADLVQVAFDFGLIDLGENRVQEMLAKAEQLAAAGRHPRWHLIGTLQRNKVKAIIGQIELIQSVDSLELVADISRQSENRGLISKILLQVNTAGEMTKHGFAPEELPEAVEKAGQSPGIRLCGLMTMAPLFPDPEMARPVFSQTRELFDRLAGQTACPTDFRILSMGMSQDFRQAIASGATLVRIGTAIFGPRM